MKILPKINNIVLENLKNKDIRLCINESLNINYAPSKNADSDIVKDLLEHKAYATMFLYLNENYTLNIEKDSFINESNIKDFYEDCNNLLQRHIKIVESQGPLMTKINNYPIYEVENGVLRGEGKMKVFESFNDSEGEDLAWDLVDFMRDFDTYEFNDNYSSDEEAANQYMKDFKSKTSINDIITFLNSIKEDSDKNSYSEEALESILARLEVLKNSIVEESKKLNESFFNLYKSYDDLYGISKYSPKELIDFLNDLKNQNKISERDYNLLIDFSNKYQDLINACGYESEELKEEGTQVSDIAPKIDYNDKVVKAPIAGLKESVILHGFLKNEKGQYQRGNYILCKENDKFVAIHKDKLEEALSGEDIFKNISTIQNSIQQKTGCTVNVEKDNNKLIFRITGNGKQLSDVMPYGDTLKELLQSWGNTVEFDVSDNTFTYTAY